MSSNHAMTEKMTYYDVIAILVPGFAFAVGGKFLFFNSFDITLSEELGVMFLVAYCAGEFLFHVGEWVEPPSELVKLEEIITNLNTTPATEEHIEEWRKISRFRLASATDIQEASSRLHAYLLKRWGRMDKLWYSLAYNQSLKLEKNRIALFQVITHFRRSMFLTCLLFGFIFLSILIFDGAAQHYKDKHHMVISAVVCLVGAYIFYKQWITRSRKYAEEVLTHMLFLSEIPNAPAAGNVTTVQTNPTLSAV